MNRISLTGVELRKRNFRGEVMDYNERGNKQCLVVLGIEQAHQLGFDSLTDMYNALKADQWAIKRFNVTDENDDPDCFMSVNAVFFDNERSNIYMKTAGSKPKLLNETTIARIDRAEIDNVDIIITKHHYNSHGREGYNNRIKSMEVTIVEDDICARNSGYDEDDELPFADAER